jgi:hypothetical protein
MGLFGHFSLVLGSSFILIKGAIGYPPFRWARSAFAAIFPVLIGFKSLSKIPIK